MSWRAGESNLKVRRPVDLREDAPAEEAEVMRLRATLTCEPPNDKLHTFRGRVIIAADGGNGARSACWMRSCRWWPCTCRSHGR